MPNVIIRRKYLLEKLLVEEIMSRVDKKSIVISFIIIVIIGIFFARFIDDRKNSVVEIGDAKAGKSKQYTVDESYEHVFIKSAKKVYVYKNNKKFATYKKSKCDGIVTVVNDIYYDVYRNEPIKENTEKYDARYEFSSSRVFYLDTKSGERNGLIIKDGKMYKAILDERQYKEIKKFLKESMRKDKKRKSKDINKKEKKSKKEK
jgi:hypothetical protein